MKSMNYSAFTNAAAVNAKLYLDSIRTYLRKDIRTWTFRRDSVYESRAEKIGEGTLLRLRERDYNDRLADIVLNRLATNKIYESERRLIQKSDPIYMPPGSKYGRAHFFAPYKMIGNMRIGTLLFNISMVWLMTMGLFVTLYYNLLKKFVFWLGRFKLPIWRKFGRDLLQI